MSELLIPAFIAGLFTFLAPCTLPLVPGYLGFISGVSAKDLRSAGSGTRRKVVFNGLMYVIGFSVIFIALGLLFGVAGSALAQYRGVLARIGGVLVIFFGLYLMHMFDMKIFGFLARDHRFNLISKLQPGKPSSSFLFGATFALGWTPCVGPILGSILLLASTTGKTIDAAILLFSFSLGLAIPFLLVAVGVGHAIGYIQRISRHLRTISFVGGLFLLFLGILLVTDSLEIWFSYAYTLFQFLNYEAILDYL